VRGDVQDALEVRVRAAGLAGSFAAGREESGMMPDIGMKLDDETLVVRIPMRFQRCGGRQRIVAPDGGEIALSQREGTR
jgi:hypothetical protein